MTVSELINNWSEEERKQHEDLIMECLEREQLLNALKGRIEATEEALTKSLDQMLSGLSQLYLNIHKTSEQMENIYLHLAKAQGNA
jgi:hypothetical protein